MHYPTQTHAQVVAQSFQGVGGGPRQLQRHVIPAHQLAPYGGVGAGQGQQPGGNQAYPWLDGCHAKPARCDCNVIGANTIGSAGILSGAVGSFTLDAGDQDNFVPMYIFITAALFNDNQTVNLAGGLFVARQPVLLLDSRSGRQPNLIRGGAAITDANSGIYSEAFGADKELECVDWRQFGSINNQQLTLTFYNVSSLQVHVFVNIWGLPTSKCVAACAPGAQPQPQPQPNNGGYPHVP